MCTSASGCVPDATGGVPNFAVMSWVCHGVAREPGIGQVGFLQVAAAGVGGVDAGVAGAAGGVVGPGGVEHRRRGRAGGRCAEVRRQVLRRPAVADRPAGTSPAGRRCRRRRCRRWCTRSAPARPGTSPAGPRGAELRRHVLGLPARRQGTRHWAGRFPAGRRCRSRRCRRWRSRCSRRYPPRRCGTPRSASRPSAACRSSPTGPACATPAPRAGRYVSCRSPLPASTV